MTKKKRVILAGSVFVTAALLLILQCLLVPKYEDSTVEGNFISEYYRDRTRHDVILIGDSDVFADYSTVRLWRQYGITSYIRGSSDQTVAQSYYLLRDTLKTELPKAVVFDVSSMTRTVLKKDAYNRITLDGMRWSPEKIRAIRASMISGESFLSYVFPILRFHSRWSQLTAADFRYLFSRPSVSYNGYYLRADTREKTVYPKEHKASDLTLDAGNTAYLEKITALCREKGITLILVKAPSLYPSWYDEWNAQITAFAEQNGVRYINCIQRKEEIGINYGTDTYDGGLHLNVNGAEKMSDYLGKILTSEYGLWDHRGNASLSAYWNALGERYDSERAAQEAEIRGKGSVSRYQTADSVDSADSGS